MNKPAITLVVPVYNVKDYLRPCLDSIVGQTFRDFEVLLVNDGSTDGSFEILQEYAARYDYFTLIDQKNSGPGEARNHGIRRANGEYVAFADADDILCKDFLERMYAEIKKQDADIVCCESKYQMPNGLRFRVCPGRHTVIDEKKAIGLLMRDQTVHHFCVNKMFKRSLFMDNGVFFPTMFFEDIATTARVFFYAKRIAFIPQALYCYVQRGGSTMHSMSPKLLQDYINAAAILRAFFEQSGKADVYRSAVRQCLFVIRMQVQFQTVLMHLQKRLPGTGRDMANVREQFRLLRLPSLPIVGCPWEDIVTKTVFDGKEVPQITAASDVPNRRVLALTADQK